MANYYVRSGATGTGDGSSWANAYTSIEGGAEAVSGAGNTLFVADGHSESHASAITLALGGTLTTGAMRALSVNDTGDPQPPTALAAGALVATTGASNITISGTGQIHGMHFRSGDGASTASILVGSGDNNTLVLDSCTLQCGNTSSSSYIGTAGSTGGSGDYDFRDCSFVFGATGQRIRLQGSQSRISIEGGAVSGSALTALFDPNASYPPQVYVYGLDVSACATGLTLINSGTGGDYIIRMVGLSLPAGWSGAVIGNTLSPASIAELIDSTDGTTRYRLWVETAWGSIRDTIHLGATVYLDGAQYDGVARYSLRFAANTYADNRSGHLVGPDMHSYAETAAASTATVQILHDGASALTDADCWLEVFVNGQWISGQRANPLSAGTAHSASAETWTGATGTGPNGSATWNALKLTCGFTPSAAGPVMGRVVMAKASTTIYADINLTVTVN